MIKKNKKKVGFLGKVRDINGSWEIIEDKKKWEEKKKKFLEGNKIEEQSCPKWSNFNKINKRSIFAILWVFFFWPISPDNL